MTDTDSPTPASESSADAPREADVPPEALEPSGRSEESLPPTAPNPARREPEADPQDGSTEIPPVTPDA